MKTIEQRIAMIRADREHGSRWLVREAIVLMHDVAMASSDESLQHVRAVARELAYARPAMAALASAMGRILHNSREIADIAHSSTHLLEEYDQAAEKIASYACPLLTGTLLTLSISGTVLDVLVACHEQIERVIVLEGRPRYEGRDMARALVEHGMRVTLITDAEAEIFLPQCDAVVVGADTVLANGDVLNKAGTALVAWAARGHKKPVYVLCETLKIAPRSWTGDMTQLEEKEGEEVLEQPIEGVVARNFYFDHTLARLATGIVTEQGIMSRKDVRKIALELKQMLKQEGLEP